MINKLLNSGVHPEMSQYERNQARLLNTIIILAFLIKFFGFLYVIIYEEVSIEQFVQTTFSLSLNVVMLYFNSKGKFNVSIWLLVFSVFLGLITTVFVYKMDSYSMMLFLLSLFSFLTIIIESKRKVIILTVVAIVIVGIGLINNYYPFYTHSVVFSAERNNTLRLASIIVIAFTLFYTVYLKSYAVQYKTKLEGAVKTITQQKQEVDQTVKQKELLLAETHHRVKNNLQLIISLLELQMNMLEDNHESKALKASISRINSMASIHKKLYKNEGQIDELEMSDYLSELAENTIALFPSSQLGVELKTQLDSCTMNLEQAIPIGLIMNEVITNSVKYATPTDKKAVFELKLSKKNEWIVISFQDNGSGISVNTESGLGHSMIDMLGRQINAEIERYNNKGLKTVIKIRKDGF